MPEPAELSHPNAFEADGILYLIGLREGTYWLRRSADSGETWLPFADDSIEKAVASGTSDQRAALVKLSSQGRPLLVCIPEWPHLAIYVSSDDGETWVRESTV